MAISLKHQFASLKSDGLDTTLVQPSNWNDEHALTCATDKLLGRVSTGTGAVEEISVSDFVQALLNSADAAAFLAAMGVGAFTTGDAKITLKTAADTGWIMANDGTIGDGTSGATYQNANAEALFTLIFNNLNDANAPILTSAGGATTRVAQTNAATAWAAHCRISLTKQLGRALVIAGTGSGLTTRTLGGTAGVEAQFLAQNQLPNTTLSVSGNVNVSGGTQGVVTGAIDTPIQSGGAGFNIYTSDKFASISPSLPATATSSLNGGVSQQSFDKMQPSAFWNIMIKL